jgi:hypothetical protein
MSDDDLEGLLEIQRRSYQPAREGIRKSWPEEDALDRPRLARLLERLRYGVLATARPDGRAHAAPVAFSHEDGGMPDWATAFIELAPTRVFSHASRCARG